jgi:hypothetical protein
MACSCTEHPLIHGDCAVPTAPVAVLYRKERKAGAQLIELARFDDEALPGLPGCTIDLTDRGGRGHNMTCAGWHDLGGGRIALFTREFHYILVDERLRAYVHHQEYLECLANNPQLPYPWQD